MRRVRKKRADYNVSLFPFLAVLICTLGVLIVMLVMATKSADDSAHEQRHQLQSSQQSELEELQATIDLHQIRAAGLKKLRPNALQRLEMSRENRSRLRSEIRDLKQELEDAQLVLQQVAQAVMQAEAQEVVEPFDQQQAAEEIEELQQALADAKEELQEKKASAQIGSGPNQYVIVPYKGAGGTFRRPIFIECVAEGLRLQPSGILLAKSDFLQPGEPGNMLDSALLTIRDYWERFDLAGEEGKPYPLLVVRPDGAETFVLARRAMKSWDDEFGYELVTGDKELDFGKPDTQLIAEVQQSIQAAKARQRAVWERRRAIAQHRARFQQTRAAPGFTASRSGGGFVAESGSQSMLTGSSGNQVQPAGLRGDQPGSQLNFAVASAGVSPADYRTSNDPIDQRLGRIARGDTLSTPTGELAKREPAIGSPAAGNPPAQPAGATGKSSQSAGQPGQPRTSNSPRPNGGLQMATKNSSQSGGNAAGKAPAGGEGNAAAGNPYADLSLAKTRGAGWALPTRTTGATGYLRPIRIVCRTDSIELFDVSGQTKRIAFSPTTESALGPMVDEIWKRIDSWGIAGTGSYWKPELRVTVAPGAEQRFQEFQGLLYQSGLAIKGGTP